MPLPRLAVLVVCVGLCFPAGQGPAWALADRAQAGAEREDGYCPSCPGEIIDLSSLANHIGSTPSLHAPVGAVLLAVWAAASFVSFALSSLLSSPPVSNQKETSKDESHGAEQAGMLCASFASLPISVCCSGSL